MSVAYKAYYRFLPAVDKDPHLLCCNCKGKKCSMDDWCSDCHDCTDNMWMKVSAYRNKSPMQREKKKKVRKIKTSFFLDFHSATFLFL